jgi:predicted type IV restriction endonuclease
MDRETLFKIKIRLEKLGDKSMGEAQTKESFINPLISALGWDIADFDEVKLEYKHTKKATPVDYALLIDMTPKLYVEAKQLGSNLDDFKWIAQILTYSTMAGVKWALLTDGNHYKLYNTTAEARLEEKLFYEWKMKDLSEDNVDEILNFLNLLTKEKFKDDEIERAWKNHFEVNKVRKALEKLIDDKDESILKLITKKTNLGKAVIVNSLNKLKIKIEKVYAPDIFPPIIPSAPSRVGFTWKVPEKAKLFDETFEVKTWRELLIAVAEKLLKYNPEAFNKLSDSEIMKGDVRTYLSKNRNKVKNPRQLSNGLFLEIMLSANGVFSLIRKMLKGCGYKETDIKIFVKETNT